MEHLNIITVDTFSSPFYATGFAMFSAKKKKSPFNMLNVLQKKLYSFL